ncbi:MAG TPA: hypothetical protein VEA16_01785, partial [Vicinamibacterales bacterium]|nr:hypothetical protein [Vicinamibacterales bacterium]
TDLVSWNPLADGRIATFVRTVNRQALSSIRCVHDELHNLVIWMVPTSSTRVRTLLAYHYLLNAWLPPITGLEYGSLTAFTDSTGELGLYAGDYWGRVYQLFDGSREGVPSGTVLGTITAATSGSITCAAATFYTTGSGLAGLPAAVKSPAGVWQWVRIASNTGTVLTLDTSNGPSLTPVPTGGGWTVVVGGIEWFWSTPYLDPGSPIVAKKGHHVYAQASASAQDQTLYCRARFNNDDGQINEIPDLDFPIPVTGAVWGSAIWGTSVYNPARGRTLQKQVLERSFFTIQLQFWNYYADADVRLTRFGLTADELPKRLVPSVES